MKLPPGSRGLKDGEIALIVNAISANVRPICTNQSLRARVSEAVVLTLDTLGLRIDGHDEQRKNQQTG